MNLGIIILPLIIGVINGLLGRYLGTYGTRLLGSSSIMIGSLLSIISYYEIAISESPLSIYILDWIDTEYLEIAWLLNIDSLSISIHIPVLIVSTCVHIYSIEYMSGDPLGKNVVGKHYCGDKLSNSGELLKVLIPNHSRKTVGGWSNNSGMVTSQNMSENEMDNCGSKSIKLRNFIVKEQRVDGNYIDNSMLRYTLIGFERNYWLKIPSNQLIIKRNYSTLN